ncbi:helix-turn-helix domain-containing protein [Lentzea sp. NPDC042327]|uniref:GlxA family transcriptional regulator n=1 Tax=Lentzea sp. NPDC042327 TaxID=3154801 RepID=UPI0033CFE00B
MPEEVIEDNAPVPPALVSALRGAHEAGARIVSLCVGAFALAEAGLLDGRRATAHWMHTALLAERYPAVRVDDSVLHVDDGNVLTSAGMTAALDWARERLDEPLTIDALARRAAVSPRTFYRRLHAATGTMPLQWLLNERIASAQALLESTDLPVEKIAALSGIGTANNLRHHFLKQVGVSPSDYRQAWQPERRKRASPPVEQH